MNALLPTNTMLSEIAQSLEETLLASPEPSRAIGQASKALEDKGILVTLPKEEDDLYQTLSLLRLPVRTRNFPWATRLIQTR